MSKKDYQLIADLLKDKLTTSSNPDEISTNTIIDVTVADVARSLADKFKRDNPKFRYDKFFEACGLDVYGELKTS